MDRLTFAFLLAGLLVATSKTQAQLELDIAGIPGSGQTTWTFSGSTTAFEIGGFDADSSDGQTFPNPGDFVKTLDLVELPALSSNAFLTVNSDTEAITAVGVDDDTMGIVPGGNTDDIGVGLANQLSVADGDTVSWTGSLVVGFDLDEFNLGTFGPSSSGLTGTILEQLTIREVPEPSSLALLSVGGVALLRRSVARNA
ncbi:MAG: PEP-CTERM sorting domain-containing protein [Planctomycetota bacterium]